MCNMRPPESAQSEPQEETISFAELQAHKQRSRDADERALANGTITREELRKQNGHFAFKGCRIRWDLVKGRS